MAQTAHGTKGKSRIDRKKNWAFDLFYETNYADGDFLRGRRWMRLGGSGGTVKPILV